MGLRVHVSCGTGTLYLINNHVPQESRGKFNSCTGSAPDSSYATEEAGDARLGGAVELILSEATFPLVP